jgi:putative membrane-bound dehydrogenase-like protein
MRYPFLASPWALLLVSPLLSSAAPSTGQSLLPSVPAPLRAELYAQEPLVRNPCALVFDARGRLFVGYGPQYRNPKPDTPGDSIAILVDSDGDGIADQTKIFATGFNCIQGLAWNGRDLWVANSPDLTIVRDLDGDDEADEYVRVYTDLGNIEHASHGLNWAPDGRLYLSVGTSKGLTQPPDRVAPKAYRDLWDVKAPEGTPDILPPRTYRKGEYKHTYQDPKDNWGRSGGVLRAGAMGANLEIVSRGTRNVWDIGFDHEFNWLGTDNDQYDGDRIIMPFFGAHFGWGHTWSADWTGDQHLPTVPISGPVFQGSGTGIVYYDSPQMPPEFRGVWFINDWLRKTTFVYRPAWDGALTVPQGGKWQEFALGRSALFQPVDIATGPDGALYLTGWGKSYGAVYQNGEQVNEGRVFRISWPDAPDANWNTPKRTRPIAEWSVAELLEDLGSTLPVWNTNAQEELVRRSSAVVPALTAALESRKSGTAQETWMLWTLGRINPTDAAIDAWFAETGHHLSANARIQSIRIAGHRWRASESTDDFPAFATAALKDSEPRVRFAAVQAIEQARRSKLVSALLELAAVESDRITYYAAWQALRTLSDTSRLTELLQDPRGGVRRAALLALLESDVLDRPAVERLIGDADSKVSELAAQWIARLSGNPLVVMNPLPGEFTGSLKIELLAGIKPAALRWTNDGSEPTAPGPKERAREGASVTIDKTSKLKIALFVPTSGSKTERTYQKVGSTVTATWVQRAAAKELPPIVLEPREQPLTTAEVLPLVEKGDVFSGQRLFTAVGCYACHRVGREGKTFGPDLTAMGDKADPTHIIESMLAPSATIAEGFALLSVSSSDGQSYAGVFKEETNRSLVLVQMDSSTVTIDKALITSRESLHLSAMPPFGGTFNPQQMADVVAFLLAQRSQALESTLPSEGPPKP